MSFSVRTRTTATTIERCLRKVHSRIDSRFEAKNVLSFTNVFVRHAPDKLQVETMGQRLIVLTESDPFKLRWVSLIPHVSNKSRDNSHNMVALQQNNILSRLQLIIE